MYFSLEDFLKNRLNLCYNYINKEKTGGCSFITDFVSKYKVR